MPDNVNADVIEKLTRALESSRAELESVSEVYHRLRAQVVAYEQTLKQLKALEDGAFETIVAAQDESPRPRRENKDLKDHIYAYFSERPRIVQTPRGVAAWLVDERGWSEQDRGLRVRVSNLLRKIEREESWLEKIGHGKYQFAA